MNDMIISPYSLIIFIALLLNILVVCYVAYKKHRLKIDILYLLIFEHIGMIYGAKIYAFLLDPAKYNYEFSLFKSGYSSLGAFIGIIIMSFIYILIFKISIKEITEDFICSIPLIYSIGKIGCYVAGCCYGIIYDGPFSITYHYASEEINGLSLFPIQLLESIVAFIIFIYTLKIVLNDKINKKNIGIFLLLVFISKFLLDFLRYTHMKEMISFNQIACIPFILIGIFLIVFKNKKLTNNG